MMTNLWTPEVRMSGDTVELGAGSTLAKQWRDRHNAEVIDERSIRTPEGKAAGTHILYVADHWIYREDDGAHLRMIDSQFVDDAEGHDRAEREAEYIADAISGKLAGHTAHSLKCVEILRKAGYNVAEVE